MPSVSARPLPPPIELAVSNRKPDAPPLPGADEIRPTYVIAPSDAALKPGDGTLSLAGMQVRIDPAAEWTQMYHEVWRIERAYFYDPNFHGAPTVRPNSVRWSASEPGAVWSASARSRC